MMVRLNISNRPVSFRLVALILQIRVDIHEQFTRRYSTCVVSMLMYMFLFFSVLLISKAYCIGGSKVKVVPLYKLELQGVKNLTR